MDIRSEKAMSRLPNREFSNIVHKELRGMATREEVAYLWSETRVVNRWRAELKIIAQELERKIITVKKDEMDNIDDKILRLAYREKIRKAKDLKRLAIERVVMIKTWQKEQRRLRNTTNQEERITFDLSCKEAYCDGWQDGINHICRLMQQGLPSKEAGIISRQHFEVYMQPWMKSEVQSFTDKPELPNSMASILTKYINLME